MCMRVWGNLGYADGVAGTGVLEKMNRIAHVRHRFGLVEFALADLVQQVVVKSSRNIQRSGIYLDLTFVFSMPFSFWSLCRSRLQRKRPTCRPGHSFF